MNFLKRALAALVLIPIVLFCVLEGGLPLLLLSGVMAAMASFEISQAVTKNNFSLGLLSIILAVFILGVAASDVSSTLPWMAIYVCILAFFVVGMFGNISREIFERHAMLGLFVVYISFGCAALFLVRDGVGKMAAPFIILTLLATWSHDIGAYLIGKSFGKRPFFKHVSPKKTWEGFWAGSVACLLFPALVKWGFDVFGNPFFVEVRSWDIFVLLFPCVFLVPLGDLIESKWKRVYDIKDSGSVIPGHGGVLDRIDVMLVTMPWVLFYLS